MKKIAKANGSFMVESAAVSVLVLLALSAIAHYYQNNKDILSDVYGQKFSDSENIKKIKEQAPLVIIGKINHIFDKEHVGGQALVHIVAQLYYDIEVEKIEKGHYPMRDITVAIGIYDNLIPSQEAYSPFLKKNYHVGDKIKIYIYYDKEQNIYYTPVLWYSIEPIENS